MQPNHYLVDADGSPRTIDTKSLEDIGYHLSWEPPTQTCQAKSTVRNLKLYVALPLRVLGKTSHQNSEETHFVRLPTHSSRSNIRSLPFSVIWDSLTVPGQQVFVIHNYDIHSSKVVHSSKCNTRKDEIRLCCIS